MPKKTNSAKSAGKSPSSRQVREGSAQTAVPVVDPATEPFEEQDRLAEIPSRPGQSQKVQKVSAAKVQDSETAASVEATGTARRKRKAIAEDEPQVDKSTPKKAKQSKKIKHEKVIEPQTAKASNRRSTKKVEIGSPPGKETSPRTKTNTKAKAKEEGEGQREVPRALNKRSKEIKVEVKQEAGEVDQGYKEAEIPKKPKRRKKSKEEKEAEAMPLAARSAGLNMFVGAHVSCAKGPLVGVPMRSYIASIKLKPFRGIGVHNTVTNCLHIGGNAFAMFLKSQRKWENPPLQNEHRDQFRDLCGQHKYDAMRHVLPHGSYLVNLAQEDPEKHEQAYNAFLDDLQRCESLGIRLYNFQ